MGSTESKYSQACAGFVGEIHSQYPQRWIGQTTAVPKCTTASLILILPGPSSLLCPCPRYKKGQSQALGVSWGLKETGMSWSEEPSSP